MGRRKERSQRAAFGNAQQRGARYANRIHDGPDVVHALVEAGKLADAIRQAGSALVEQDDPREAAQAKQPAREIGLIPIVLDMRHETGSDNEIDRTASEDLVGDMNVAAFGVAGDWGHAVPSGAVFHWCGTTRRSSARVRPCQRDLRQLDGTGARLR